MPTHLKLKTDYREMEVWGAPYISVYGSVPIPQGGNPTSTVLSLKRSDLDEDDAIQIMIHFWGVFWEVFQFKRNTETWEPVWIKLK
jgi:hypothetical protein